MTETLVDPEAESPWSNRRLTREVELIIGTTNAGKVRQMVGALASLPITCVPIQSVATSLPDVEELGDTAAEVAATKARIYSQAIGRPVLALDHWLRFPEASAEHQPLARVRRIPGRPEGASDEELLDYYRRLCHQCGGALTAQWELGVAYADGPTAEMLTVTVERQLVPEPSPVRMPGLPLSALQIDVETGRYVSEHEAEDEIALWQRVYGPKLPLFVSRCMDWRATP